VPEPERRTSKKGEEPVFYEGSFGAAGPACAENA